MSNAVMTTCNPDGVMFDDVDWKKFMQMANKKNIKLYQTLNIFRQMGLQIQKNKGVYILTPKLGGEWETQADYERDRDKWLIQYRQEIICLLDSMDIVFPCPVQNLPAGFDFDPMDIRRDPKLDCNVLDPGWWKDIGMSQK